MNFLLQPAAGTRCRVVVRQSTARSATQHAIGGKMAGAGLRYRMISRIVVAWLFTLPVTNLIAGGLYYLRASPRL